MPQETTEPLFPPGTVFPEDGGAPILPKPERIEILYQPMGYDLFYHTLIVYTDSEGKQWAARGGPDAWGMMLRTSVQPYERNEHADWDDKGTSLSMPVAEGTDLSAVWKKISDAVLEMDNKSRYENLNNNCQTVTSHGLHAAGINFRLHPDISDWQAPGAEKNPDGGVDFLNGDAKPDVKDDSANGGEPPASPEESPDLPESPSSGGSSGSGGSGSWSGLLDNILGTLGSILDGLSSRGALGGLSGLLGNVLNVVSNFPWNTVIDNIRNPASPEPSNPESPAPGEPLGQTPVETPVPSGDPDGNSEISADPAADPAPVVDPGGFISGNVQEPVYVQPIIPIPDSWTTDPIVVVPEPEPEDRDRLAIESPLYEILTHDKDGNPVTIKATYLYDGNGDPVLDDHGIHVLEDTDGRRLSVYEGEGEGGDRAIYEDGGYPWDSDGVGGFDEPDLSDGNTGLVIDLPQDDYDSPIIVDFTDVTIDPDNFGSAFVDDPNGSAFVPDPVSSDDQWFDDMASNCSGPCHGKEVMDCMFGPHDCGYWDCLCW
jgi:hypothetical protein